MNRLDTPILMGFVDNKNNIEFLQISALSSRTPTDKKCIQNTMWFVFHVFFKAVFKMSAATLTVSVVI